MSATSSCVRLILFNHGFEFWSLIGQAAEGARNMLLFYAADRVLFTMMALYTQCLNISCGKSASAICMASLFPANSLSAPGSPQNCFSTYERGTTSSSSPRGVTSSAKSYFPCTCCEDRVSTDPEKIQISGELFS